MTNFIPRKQSYAFLYDESYRNNIVTTLLRKPMSKTEFLMLVELCKPCKIDIIDLAIFTLASSIDSEK